jgi:hypothetical protein
MHGVPVAPSQATHLGHVGDASTGMHCYCWSVHYHGMAHWGASAGVRCSVGADQDGSLGSASCTPRALPSGGPALALIAPC